MINYTLVAGIILYVLILRRLESPSVTYVKGATIFMALYMCLQVIVSYLFLSSLGIAFSVIMVSVFSLEFICVVLLQYGVALVTFYKVDGTGDDYMAYVLWGGLGLAGIFFIVPAIIHPVVQTFL